MRFPTLFLAGALAGVAAPLAGQHRPLLPDSVIGALAGEVSGETAKRNLERLAGEHRIRPGSTEELEAILAAADEGS